MCLCVPSVTFFVCMTGAEVCATPGLDSNLEVSQQQAWEAISTGAQRTTPTLEACVTVLKSWDMRICKEETAKQNVKWYHLTAKQRPELKVGRKEGPDDFRFTKRFSRGPLPFQISKDKGPYCLGSACRASLGVVHAQRVRYWELGNSTLPDRKMWREASHLEDSTSTGLRRGPAV